MNKKSNDGFLSWGSAIASLASIVAILATSCCIVPLVLVNIGLGGAWIANLSVLQPYRIYLLIATGLLCGVGIFLYIHNLLKPCEVCQPKRTVRNILVPAALTLSIVLIILAIALPSIEPQLLRALR